MKKLLILVLLSSSVGFANERNYEFNIQEKQRLAILERDSKNCMKVELNTEAINANCNCDLVIRAEKRAEAAVQKAQSKVRSQVGSCERSGPASIYSAAVRDKEWPMANWLLSTNQVKQKGVRVVTAGCENTEAVLTAEAALEAQNDAYVTEMSKASFIRGVLGEVKECNSLQ